MNHASGWVPEQPGVPENNYRPIILHEFGHALGPTDEHQTYTVAWRWNVQASYDYFDAEPNRCGPDMPVKENISRVCKEKLLRMHFLDRDSIMLHSSPDQFFTDGRGTAENYELLDMDKAAVLVRYVGQDARGYTKNVATSDKDGVFYIMRSCMGMEEDSVALTNSAIVGDC